VDSKLVVSSVLLKIEASFLNSREMLSRLVPGVVIVSRFLP
jgi:hypothetical protein